MLLERNQATIGLVITILIAIGTAFAVGATGGALVPGERYVAEFPDAAGLEDGNFVFLAGVRVGQVTEVELLPDRVRVEFSNTGPEIAQGATADIIIANTLGKRAIRINIGDGSGTLSPGDEVGSLEVNNTPIDVPELGDRSAELLTELDVEALQDLTTALADVAEASRDDLSRLLVGIEDVSQIVIDRRTELEALLSEGSELIRAVDEVDQDIIRIIDAFGSTLDTLDARRGDVQRLLTATVDATDTANDLLLDREDQLDQILDDLHTDLQVVQAHQGDIAHIFAYIGVGLDGFSSIGYTGLQEKADNPGWGNVFAQELGPIGVEALLGCGGDIDAIFSQTVGPDPRCEEGAVAAAEVIAPEIAPASFERAGLRTFFELGAAR